MNLDHAKHFSDVGYKNVKLHLKKEKRCFNKSALTFETKYRPYIFIVEYNNNRLTTTIPRNRKVKYRTIYESFYERYFYDRITIYFILYGFLNT